MAANPSNLPVVFNFGKQTIRTIDRNGEVWFVASDVCAVLEISNPTSALGRLDEDERAMFNIGNTLISNEGNSTARGNPNANIINESGLFSLVLSSRKAEAKAFKRWVTHDVLPAIRKTGAYAAPQLAAPAPAAAPKKEFINPREVHSAEAINERIEFRALQLSHLMHKKFLADMRQPSQFHYFRTGDNVPEAWQPQFGASNAIDGLRVLACMADDMMTRYKEIDAEWEALLEATDKANGIVRQKSQMKKS